AQGTAFYSHKENLKTVVFSPDSTYNQQQHLFYYGQLKKADSQLTGGVLLIVAGSGMFIGGVSVMASNYQKWLDSSFDDSGNGKGLLLTLVGGGAIGAGIPLIVLGGRSKRKYRDKIREMEKPVTLNLQVTENGAGITLNF
ncbi:MAG: hypothetical protein P8100_09565, partial [bacterium]